MDSELLTCLLKFIEYFPDYLSALSLTLLRFFWTTFVETAVNQSGSNIYMKSVLMHIHLARSKPGIKGLLSPDTGLTGIVAPVAIFGGVEMGEGEAKNRGNFNK